eukprot:TRINITY_DN67_c0_g1_i2.p1 TRINITY_DN67_c0_g1~~TRINITY_DN67_c0_g1_i2.p1  ORF type:complete len:344 (-),score=40.17 TRINITY_DN67_c0_g1_i2:135-1166(-)
MDDFIEDDDDDEPHRELIDSELEDQEVKAVDKLKNLHKSIEDHFHNYIACISRIVFQKGFEKELESFIFDKERDDQESEASTDQLNTYFQAAQKIEKELKHRTSQVASVLWTDERLMVALHQRTQLDMDDLYYSQFFPRRRRHSYQFEEIEEDREKLVCQICNRSNHEAKFKLQFTGKIDSPGWVLGDLRKVRRKRKKEKQEDLVFYAGSVCKDRILLFHTLNYFILGIKVSLLESVNEWWYEQKRQNSILPLFLETDVYRLSPKKVRRVYEADQLQSYLDSWHFKYVYNKLFWAFESLIEVTDEFLVQTSGWQMKKAKVENVTTKIMRDIGLDKVDFYDFKD